ncbi:MAG: hypothetical protein MRY59_03240 [Aquisalinus sp.]|nr:hypothetical protein [Aquisalinus sp.]
MSGIAFLIMLASFSFLAYWYIRNLEQGDEGTFGLLGLNIGDADEVETDEKTEAETVTSKVNLERPDQEAPDYKERQGKAYAREDKSYIKLD